MSEVLVLIWYGLLLQRLWTVGRCRSMRVSGEKLSTGQNAEIQYFC